jgi:sporulation protein YlmC with PRC-barrel domain
MALQSSNIFNQNNTSQNLSAFLGQVKDIQMNPKLQKILGKAIEDDENSVAAASNEMTTVSPPPRHVPIASSSVTTTTTTTQQQVTSMATTGDQFCNVSGGGDTRDCFTCHGEGDSGVCGRLLPFDSYWVHINCLLWSEDVTVLNEHMIDPIESILLRMKTVCTTLSINLFRLAILAALNLCPKRFYKYHGTSLFFRRRRIILIVAAISMLTIKLIITLPSLKFKT